MGINLFNFIQSFFNTVQMTFQDVQFFKNILKNSIGGENRIVFCLQKDNFDIKIESDENFKINLNFLNKLKETRGIKNIIKKN